MTTVLLRDSKHAVLVLGYLDLGTGSFLFQAALAGLFGALYFFKGKLQQFKTLFQDTKRHKGE